MRTEEEIRNLLGRLEYDMKSYPSHGVEVQGIHSHIFGETFHSLSSNEGVPEWYHCLKWVLNEEE